MKIKDYKEKYEKKIKKKDMVIKKFIDVKWIITITIMAFLITVIFSTGSDLLMRKVNVVFGILIIIFFILIGVITDMIGIAVTSADKKPFNSMSSKNIKGSKMAIKMLKNAEKVSAFCNDVIGDICNIMSGSAGIFIAASISLEYNIDITVITLIITALIASATIGGKAIGKSAAINKSEVIVYYFAKIASSFTKKDNI
ncbi:MAG: hypothetical protein PHQ89_01905 [Bacilli bacterium]|nr:hypothetical protein [Bacilli bacterium]